MDCTVLELIFDLLDINIVEQCDEDNRSINDICWSVAFHWLSYSCDDIDSGHV